MKRALCLLLVCILCLSFASCGNSDGKKDSNDVDVTVSLAIEKLKAKWSEVYKKNNVKDQYLEIKNTRVITIKENDNDYFKDIDKIVDFLLYDNYFGMKPSLYRYSGTDLQVIFYRDGHSAVSNDYFKLAFGKNYDNDFSDVVEDIYDLGAAYNKIYHLEKDSSEESKTSSKSSKTVDKAVELLKSKWTENYHNEKHPVDDGCLEIKNTRVITIKENDNEHFKDVDRIVEFLFFDNYFDMKPSLYRFDGNWMQVIFYRDGHTEVLSSDYFKLIFGTTYETDYTDVIESIDDLGDTCNAIYHL